MMWLYSLVMILIFVGVMVLIGLRWGEKVVVGVLLGIMVLFYLMMAIHDCFVMGV